MLKMASQIDNIVNAYKTLAKIPSIVGARINKNGNKISSKWSTRNLDKGKTTKFIYDYVLDGKLNVISKSDFGVDASTELLSAISPSEQLKAIIREEKDVKDAKKQYLEVWKANQLVHCIDLTALDVHGDVYADGEFGCLDWSPDESSLLYVAERKLAKSEPYIKRKPVKDAAKEEGEAPKKGSEYVYKQDWGEQLVGKHLSAIVVCRLADESVTILTGLPESWCPGQVSFSADGAGVVGVAWETEPRRLGLIFCTNRPSFVFSLTLDGQMTKLSSEGLAVRSPRVCPSGDVIWLQRTAGGPHHAAHALLLYDVNTKQTSTLIPTTPISSNEGPFKGIYSQALPRRCFSSDAKRLVFSTPQENEVRSYVFDIDSKTLVDISVKSAGSTSILDVNNDVIVAVRSDITTAGQLHVARLPAKGREVDLLWCRVSDPVDLPTSVSKANVEYLALSHDNDDAVKSFTAIFVAPPGEAKRPLIVWPHGGPHSNFVNAYALETALFTMLGFACLQINFRGSTGQGQASVDYLPSRAGAADVTDCKLATDTAVSRHAIDANNLMLFGGSHGGFLVTHLSGQYPDVYRAVVTRNPVIDVASMFNSSDIPDWCAVEAGFAFTESGPVSEEELLTMRRCSPLAHVHKVRAPTALMLGAVDKRVPYYQGLEYYRRLRANGVKTKLYMYEDCHSLSSAAVEMDNLINSAAWFFEHMAE